MAPNDPDDVDENANRRRSDRTETVEDILSTVREDLGEQRYPVSSEELSAYYADRPLDLKNETESLGSVFDRLENSFEDEQEAYEAFVTEFEQGEHVGDRTDGVADEGPYWDEERAATQQRPSGDEVEEPRYDGTALQSRQEASEAQAEAWEEKQAAEGDSDGDVVEEASEVVSESGGEADEEPEDGSVDETTE